MSCLTCLRSALFPDIPPVSPVPVSDLCSHFSMDDETAANLPPPVPQLKPRNVSEPDSMGKGVRDKQDRSPMPQDMQPTEDEHLARAIAASLQEGLRADKEDDVVHVDKADTHAHMEDEDDEEVGALWVWSPATETWTC